MNGVFVVVINVFMESHPRQFGVETEHSSVAAECILQMSIDLMFPPIKQHLFTGTIGRDARNSENPVVNHKIETDFIKKDGVMGPTKKKRIAHQSVLEVKPDSHPENGLKEILSNVANDFLIPM